MELARTLLVTRTTPLWERVAITEWTKAYSGKGRCDPDNRLRINQNIPLAG